MRSIVKLEKLYTSSDLYEGLLRFGEKDTLRDKCYFPTVDTSSWHSLPVETGAAGAVISIRTMFGKGQEVVSDLVTREVTVILNWAELWFKGSALSLVSFYRPKRNVKLRDSADQPSSPLPPDTPMICDQLFLELLVIPLRPKWARQNGSSRTVLFEEHVSEMTKAYFGPNSRKKHLEALKASLLDHLQSIRDGHHNYGPLPNRFMAGIDHRVEELKAASRAGPMPDKPLAKI